MIAALFAASLGCAAPMTLTPTPTPTLAPYPWPTSTVDPLFKGTGYWPLAVNYRDLNERTRDAEQALMVTWAYLYAYDDAKWLRDEIDQHFRRARVIGWEEFKRKQMEKPRPQ